jgi:hypothetical protein
MGVGTGKGGGDGKGGGGVGGEGAVGEGSEGTHNNQHKRRGTKSKKGPQAVSVTLPDGGTYEGFLNARGQKHGEGKLTLGPGARDGRAGEKFEGEFENDRRSGEGTCWYADGRKYVGWWEADKEDGEGVMEYPAVTPTSKKANPPSSSSNSSLLPPLVVVHPQQQSRLLGRSVVAFRGEWRKGQRNGEGQLEFKDGTVLKAHWQGGELMTAHEGSHGFGFDPSYDQPSSSSSSPTVLEYSNGTVVSDCVFVGHNDEENGGDYQENENGDDLAFVPSPHSSPPWALASEHVVRGTETLPATAGGGQEVYIGAFNSGGLRHGDDGECVFSDGSVYRGAWRNGRRNGKGYFQDGKTKEVYEGKWVAGQRCGRGLCTYPAGHRYEGEWKQDLQEGSGTFFKNSGESYSGSWKKGERHGHGVATDPRGRVMTGSWKLGVLLEEGDSGSVAPYSPSSSSSSSSALRKGAAAGGGRGGSVFKDDETLASLASLDGPSITSGTSYDFNADMAFA